MTDTLDLDLRQVFQDRRLLDRVVRTIQLDRGGSHSQAYDALAAGTEAAYSSRQPTLRKALEQSFVDLSYAGSALKMLEQRDQVVDAAAEQVNKRLAKEQVDRLGRVLLDADIGDALVGQKERERRLARARKATGQFGGGDGRAQFFELDRQHLESGIDLVRTMERPAQLQAAQAKAATVARQLDQAIAGAAEKRGKLKALEAEVGKLRGGELANFEAARAQLRAKADEAAREPLRLLDQMSSGLRTLDQGGRRKRGKAVKRSPEEERKLLEQLAVTQGPAEYARTLEAWVTGKPLPELPAPETAADETPAVPPGVYGPSHDLHQRVTARMVELDSDYVTAFEAVTREERGL